MNYLERLVDSAKRTNSIVCMGLDPVIEAMPKKYADEGIGGVPGFFGDIFDNMVLDDISPGAFKPNVGYYLVHDRPRSREFKGSKALADILDTLREMFPNVPVILDFKRGDIAKSSSNYAFEGFDCWKADAVTVSPYMGTDSVSPFTKYCNDEHGKGVYVLNRTSNPGAADFQDLSIFPSCENPLLRVVAERIVDWSKDHPGVGAVVGATSRGELESLAEFYAGKDIPLLIPGVGGQGGKADEVIVNLKQAKYDLSLARINSSSELTHPWVKRGEAAPDDFAQVCAEAVHNLNELIAYKP